MDKQNIGLTPTEWNLMECLWEKSPRTGRDAADYLRERIGWTRSTTLTLLRRMTAKGYIACEEPNGIKLYSPLIRREDTAMRETENFLGRVYNGSVSLMMSAITKNQELSQDELDELYAILQQAQEAKV